MTNLRARSEEQRSSNCVASLTKNRPGINRPWSSASESNAPSGGQRPVLGKRARRPAWRATRGYREIGEAARHAEPRCLRETSSGSPGWSCRRWTSTARAWSWHRPPTRPARRWPLRADGALRPRRRALCRGRRAGRQCGERRAVTAASSRGPPWQREPFPNLTHVPTANRSQSCPTQMTLSPSAPRDTPANVKLAGAAPWCGCDDDELVDRGAREPRKAQSADADGAPHEWNDDVGHARVCHGPSSAELGEVAPPLLRR